MSLMQAYRTKSVTLVRHKGEDTYQEPLATDTEAHKVFPEWKNRNVTDLDGEIVVSKACLKFRLLTVIQSNYATRVANTISYRDTITVDGISYKIVSFEEPRDFTARFTGVYIA